MLIIILIITSLLIIREVNLKKTRIEIYLLERTLQEKKWLLIGTKIITKSSFDC